MRSFLSLALLLFWSSAALAQTYVPEKRVLIERNVDFFGSDLAPIFDITGPACEQTCLNNPTCSAYTYNTRSSACFPKSAVTERKPYEGAISARVLKTEASVLAGAAARAAELGFLGESDLQAALDFATGLSRRYPAGGGQVQDLLQDAQIAAQSGNQVRRVQFLGAATAISDAPAIWIEFALAAGQVRSAGNDLTRDLRRQGYLAAINGYLRSAAAPQRAEALATMAPLLEREGRGRDMISALRLAQAQFARSDTEAALTAAIGKYGFRVTETTVDSDAASPRICAVFSEPLVQAGTDYEPFVQRADPGMTISVSDRQLCVDGLRHGQRYQLTLRTGLPSAEGAALIKPVTITQYVRDRSPSLRFPGRAYVLPKGAGIALPIQSVNVTTVDLRLRRVSDRNLLRAIQDDLFGRPLAPWQVETFASQIGQDIWQGTGTLQSTLNQDMTTRLPLDPALGQLAPGIYALEAAIPGADPYQNAPAMQWFVVSDIGLATTKGIDGLHVFTRSLATARPSAALTATLLSRANEVLGTAVTDEMGHALFAPGLTRGQGAAAPAMVMVQGQGDMTFLSLTDPAFDLSDRGVEGREPSGPVDVFLTTDRGAYRAGEVVNATALVRDAEARAISGLPLTAVLSRPDGVEYSRRASSDVAAGGHVLSFALGASVPRGTWRLALFTDPKAPAVATSNFLVEDFLPERIDFDLSLPDGPLPLGQETPLTVTAKYLFGPPGADLTVQGDMLIRAVDTLDGFPGYRFGRYDDPFEPVFDTIAGGERTGADGVAVLSLAPFVEANDPRPLEARITVQIAEGSGRPVERRIQRALTPKGAMIGIKPAFDDVVPQGAEAAFALIGLSPDKTPMPMRVKWTINRVETRYQWYNLFGNWNWDPVTLRSRVATGEVDLGASPVTVSAPTDWGRYEIVVERLGTDYAASSAEFYAGWYAPADVSSTPDTLDVSLDKAAYLSGQTAQLRIAPRYDGTALVTVVSNRVIDMRAVEVKGETVVDLPVTDDWGAGVYVTATLIRPSDAEAGRNPARALGLMYASVDPGDRALDVSLEAPQIARPRGPLDVSVAVGGAGAGQKAWVTLAAVDVGILNLTAFPSPDPRGHYFGQRKLGVEMRDIYGRLIDGMNGALGQVRSGGDASTGMQIQSPPPTEDLVAYFSGPVEVGEDGRANISFDMPAFNGTVRLMAVAWSPGGVGQAQADVIVRDPVVVSASVPRFLAPGDESRMLLEFVHASGPAGAMDLAISADGLELDKTAIPAKFDLGEGAKKTYAIPIMAGQPRVATLKVTLTTPGGELLTKELRLPVQINDPQIATTRRFALAGGDTFTFSRDVFAALRPGTGSATLALGSLGQLDAPGLLQALDRYPYGCTEQVTSQALPLLYLGQVASAMGQGSSRTIGQRIDEAIANVLTNQSSNGAFGLWSPGAGDFWLDAYVSDFLSRARGLGYDVPQGAFRMAMDNLRNRVNFAADFDSGGEDIAYALMVLAREGAASMGDLRYFADVKETAFATPLASAQLGAALALYGDQLRAERMFARAMQQVSQSNAAPDAPVWRDDYGTALRDAAAVLALAAEVGSTAINRAVLTEQISRPGERSTQEAAWTLLAAKALIDETAGPGFTIDGAPATGPLVRVLQDQTAARSIAVRNTSADAATLTLTTFGVPEVAPAQGGKGYRIDRSYFTMQGEAVQPSGIAVGTRLVTVIRVTPFQQSQARLMVNDPLPAGFEIDNPNLLQTGDIRALDWLQLKVYPQSTEFRSDRFLAAVDWRSDEPFELAYIVRAVSPGAFHHPAASVEDMYRPTFRANTDAGRVSVTE